MHMRMRFIRILLNSVVNVHWLGTEEHLARYRKFSLKKIWNIEKSEKEMLKREIATDQPLFLRVTWTSHLASLSYVYLYTPWCFAQICEGKVTDRSRNFDATQVQQDRLLIFCWNQVPSVIILCFVYWNRLFKLCFWRKLRNNLK